MIVTGGISVRIIKIAETASAITASDAQTTVPTEARRLVFLLFSNMVDPNPPNMFFYFN